MMPENNFFLDSDALRCYNAMACEKSFAGMGFEGYRQAIFYLAARLNGTDL